jgi:hypothetical protein
MVDTADPRYGDGVRVLRRLCVNTNIISTSCIILPGDYDLIDDSPNKSGCADVYHGRMRSSKQEVAVKCLRLPKDELDKVTNTQPSTSVSLFAD